MKILIFAILTLTLLTLRIQAQQWKEVNKIVASDRHEKDFFGNSVAISGNYAVVGADEKSEYVNNVPIYGAGAAYIFYNDNGNWRQIQKISASDKASMQHFGRLVAISGEYVIVGSLSAVHIYYNNNGTWEETQKINHHYNSISISENYAILGSFGSAYIYKNNNGIWEEMQEITTSDNSGSFGCAVAISGDYAIVGAPSQHNYDVIDYYEAGAAYIFHNNNGIWQETQKITASNGCSYGNFGYSLAISNKEAIVGANYWFGNPAGYAVNNEKVYEHYIYFFSNNQGVWEEVTRFSGGQNSIVPNGPTGSYIGESISMSKDFSIAGAPGCWEDNGDGRIKTGAAYIYGVYSELIKASDATNGDHFGGAVAISDGYAIVGVSGEAENAEGMNPISNAGAAYIFKAKVINSHPYFAHNLCVNDTVAISVSGYNITGCQWQISTDDGISFTDIAKSREYAGSQTTNLRFIAKSSMNDYQFRCKVISYDEIVISNKAILHIESIKPVILSVPADQTLTGNNNCEAELPDYTGSINATDNCDNDLEIKQTPAPGTLISGNLNEIILEITDDAGNSENVSFNVAVADNITPSIECIENKTIIISERKSSYTVARNEFDPVIANNNCGVKLIENDFNNQATLAGAKLPVGVNKINWIVIDEYGNSASCSSEITIIYTTDKKTKQSASIEGLEKSGIFIYPNPTKDILKFDFGQNKVQKLMISDLNGKTFMEKTGIDQRQEFDLSFLEKGVYLITIHTDIEIFTTKFMKE